jgi:type I restriction enzyme S subunit
LGGGTPSKSDSSFWTDGTIPWVSPKDMKTFHIVSSEDAVTPAALKRLSLVPEQSVLLVVRSGILSRTLPVALNAMPVTINQDMRAFVPQNGVSSRFIAWQLLAREREILESCSKDGTTVASIESPALATFPIVLAPPAEQTRIVAKLEELLSDLDAGVAELKAAHAKLAQYRQSLLKAAVEGTLTADRRARRAALETDRPAQPGDAENRPRPAEFHASFAAGQRRRHETPPTGGCAVQEDSADGFETGAQLLARILTERRTRWEARQLARLQSQGKTPPKGWQSKYPEPVAPDTRDLPELPEGWVWASIEQVSEIQGGIQKQPSRAPVQNKYPFLRVANVARGQLKLDEIHEIELFEGELEKLALNEGDLLIVEGNGSRSEIGRCAIWDASIPNAVHQNHLIRARSILLLPQFLEAWLNSPHGIDKMAQLAATTSGLYTLSVSKIAKIPVPVPPIDEQTEIVEQLGLATDEARRQERAVDAVLKQSAAQRQNLLKAAFSGRLVPQDPNDEPASVLLERIRAERTASSSARKRPLRKVSHA